MRQPDELFEVDALLGPGGRLSAVFPQYEDRPEQLKLARQVELAFRERRYLVAEAGTGTGKTLAYLLPAILSGRKVVIATATKTLQDQLFFKDLPLVRDQLDLPVSAAYVKGRANYLCIQRFEAFARAPDFARREEAQHWPTLSAWALRTKTGDRAEVALPDGFSAWPRMTSSSENCLGSQCPAYEACFVTKMRRRAEEADLLVVNHHLFFADLALRTGKGSGEGVLPRYDAVIFDEAHGLEDAATDFFGYSVSNFRLTDLAEDAQKALPGEDARSGMLAALAVKMRGHADALYRNVPRQAGLSEQNAVRLRPETFAPLARQFTELSESLGALASFSAGAEEPELTAVSRRSSELAAQLDFIRRAESLDHVYWGEARGGGVFLRSAPIEIAQQLRERLYRTVDTVVFTSATLRAGGSFRFFLERVGLAGEDAPERPVTQVALSSSFRYPEQAVLYSPRGMPEPNAPDFVDAAAEEILRLLEITGGRAFCLFTSLRNMERAHQRVRDRVGLPVLLQGEAPKASLIARFVETPSVLFAAQSFWEGVDVPGDALSLVVMDKLPFASPGDPLVGARIDRLRERGQDAFDSYQLPEAAIALRQGFGRLIRTSRDRGIVAILDPRLLSKRYGAVFLKSLPPVPRLTDLDALRQKWEALQPRQG